MVQASMPLSAGNYLEKMYRIAVWERYTISYSSKYSLEGGENIFSAICWRILQRRMKIVTFFIDFTITRNENVVLSPLFAMSPVLFQK